MLVLEWDAADSPALMLSRVCFPRMPRKGVEPALPSAQSSKVSQTKDICLAFPVNRPALPQGHRRQWQYRPEPHHSLRCHCLRFTSRCSSLPSSHQFCLSSLCAHPSVSPFLPSLYHLLADLSGTSSLWVSRVVSVLCPAPARWHRAEAEVV